MFVSSGAKIGKFLSIVMGIAMIIAGFSACSQGSSSNSGGNGNVQGPIKIGFSVSLTGDFSSDGKYTLQGYQLWANTVNKNGGLLGHQVQLVYLDDASKPEQATTDYQKLINIDHVNLVVAPFGFEVVPAALVASRYGYAFVDGTGTTPDVFQQGLHNLFAVSLSTQNYLASFALYILSLPISERPATVVYATGDDPFTKPQVDTAKALLDKGGVKALDYVKYPDETTDFTPIAQKLINSGAQLAVIGSLGPQDSDAFVQAFKQQHYNPKALIFASGPDQGTQFTGPIGIPSTEGIFVPNDGWWPGSTATGNAQFVQDYIAQFGGTADAISSDTVQAYTAGQVLQQAVQKANSLKNSDIMTALSSGQAFSSIQGPVQFDSTGQNRTATAFLFQWQKGNLIPVYPANQAQSNPEYPKPSWP